MRWLQWLRVQLIPTLFLNYYIQMSCRTEINQSLSSIVLFLRQFKTFQVGQLANICECLNQDSTIFEDKSLSKLLLQFLTQVNDQNKKNKTQQQYISILIIQSLIYNLYRNNSKNGLNSSIYSNSLMISSNSQINFNQQTHNTLKNQQSIQDHLTRNFVSFVLQFITDDQLQKKLKKMIQRGSIKAGEDGINQNQRYTDILLQTIQYILKNDWFPQKQNQIQNFRMSLTSKNTKTISSHYQKKNFKIIIGEVNKIIFSNLLNRIAFVLSQAEQRVFFSLLRIYFGKGSDDEVRKGKDAKYYLNLKYNGEQMFFNLIWFYVQSISNKNQLFQTSKNPLFRLIQAYLLCFYMPVFRKFNEVVGKCCKYDFDSNIQFYKVCENTIRKDLGQFIQLLPSDLIQYLRNIYNIILVSESKHSKKQSSTVNLSSIAMIAVKKLLIYSLLARPVLIQSFYSQSVDLSKYEQSCNNLINLFFKSTLKKHQNLNSQEFQLLNNLTKTISNKLQQRIVSSTTTVQQAAYLQQFEQNLVTNYIIEQPILNYDYEIVWDVIKNVQFTPKDLKQFEMRKKSDIHDMSHANFATRNNSLNMTSQTPILNFLSPRELVQSPMHKGKKDIAQFNNESIQYYQNTDNNTNKDIDFLTWMTIGGSKNYTSKFDKTQSLSLSRSLRNPRQKFIVQTFPKQKVKQVTKLYQKYQNMII